MCLFVSYTLYTLLVGCATVHLFSAWPDKHVFSRDVTIEQPSHVQNEQIWDFRALLSTTKLSSESISPLKLKPIIETFSPFSHVFFYLSKYDYWNILQILK